MHGFYLFLKVILNYSLRLFYRKIEAIGTPNEYFGSTIYVCNHPASFMDPLILGAMRKPVVFFMTRADVFNKATQPIFRAAHMLPIYRERDGVATKSANEQVFETCAELLIKKRNLLLFGEGFTDDVFERRLKPLKKGAARIGFLTLEKSNWEKPIYMAATGLNYETPNKMRSIVFIKTSEKICLNDYKEKYLENPSKTIVEVTNRMAQLLEEQVIHVQNERWFKLVEQVLQITQKGIITYVDSKKTTLFNKWTFSKKIANWVNEKEETNSEQLETLEKATNAYYQKLDKNGIKDELIAGLSSSGKLNFFEPILKALLLLPFALVGFIHCLIPYLLVKRFTEKSFKRPVFWGSVKMLVGMIVMGLVNIPVIFILHFFIESYSLCIVYYILIGLFGLSSYLFIQEITQLKSKLNSKKSDLYSLKKERIELEKMIEAIEF
ncbi:MAG: hypothetical protein RIT10_847 [Bacteroidota bacterium]|jgi:1-acyl-sn-glycerol-3-phosphate acyltransferase